MVTIWKTRVYLMSQSWPNSVTKMAVQVRNQEMRVYLQQNDVLSCKLTCIECVFLKFIFPCKTITIFWLVPAIVYCVCDKTWGMPIAPFPPTLFLCDTNSDSVLNYVCDILTVTIFSVFHVPLLSINYRTSRRTVFLVQTLAGRCGQRKFMS